MRTIPPLNCCGCSACSAICPVGAIEMRPDREGFLYPHIDSACCISCNQCRKVCPVLHINAPRTEIKKAFAVKNRDVEIRRTSSSGGVFFALSERMIRDGGVVFGVGWNEDFSRCRLQCAQRKEELVPLQGSKYLQADPQGCFRQLRDLLKEGKNVLFTGTPCQVAGLKHFLKDDTGNLLTVEVVCHGAPSPSLWERYLKDILSSCGDHAAMTGCFHRDKTPPGGWKKYNMRLEWKNAPDPRIHSRVTPSHYWADNTYMNIFLSDLGNRPSCAHCPAKNFRSGADLTIGDFWSMANSPLDDDTGLSLVIAHTAKGKAFFDRIADAIEFQEVPYQTSIPLSCSKSLIPHPHRKKFFQMIQNGESLDSALKKNRPYPLVSRIKRYILYRLQNRIARIRQKIQKQ